MLQWLNLTPSSLHPVQFIISHVIPGALNSLLHFSAVIFLSSSSFAMVAFRASQSAQFMPQQAIIFPIFQNFLFVTAKTTFDEFLIKFTSSI